MQKLISIVSCGFQETVLNNPMPTLVLYHSRWIPQSTALLPAFERLAKDLDGRCIVGQADGDAEAEIDAWFRIIDFPTAVLYARGREIGRLCGVRSPEQYLAFVDSHLLPSQPLRDCMPDTWVGIDRLGRTLPTAQDTGLPKGDKTIAMFYFISFGENDPDPANRQGPFDNSRILAENPGAIDNPSSPPWGPYNTAHHWGESLYGYYLASDEYVIAKHAQMLSDAGVDVIIFDVSNFQNTNPPGAYFYNTFMAVFRTFDRIRRSGRATPQIAFLFNFWSGPYAIWQIYQDLYSQGLYKDLWFLWEGKPLVMFDPAKVPADDAEIRGFFTFRRPMPDYFYGPQGPDQWAWCEISPQHGFYSATEPHRVEQVPVSVAQNAVPDAQTPGGWTLGCMSQRDAEGRYVARGRSFCEGRQPDEYHPEQGANFAEQWNRALALDPRLVFITGWNEWVMGRMPRFIHHTAANVMVDQFDTEFSRDLEPSRGPVADSAYCQFIQYARRFKGVRPIPASSGPVTIDLAGDFEQWRDVGPDYLDDIGDIESRCHEGYGTIGIYQSDTGRNDLAVMKVGRDGQNVYFYARTAEPLTEHTGLRWMNLLIRTGSDAPGWEGFQFLIGRKETDAGTMLLERCTADIRWQQVCRVPYRAEGCELMLAVPLEALGFDASRVTFDFKWCDNVPLGTDPHGLEFYTHGDTAPNGRFSYRYVER